MLTRKQKDLLLFIHERMQGGDIAPSFEEMKGALNLKSKSGIHRLIGALVERGYLERLPNRARALQVRKLPDGYSASNDAGPVKAAANVIRAAATNISGLMQLPVYGRIAAGTPIEAIQDETRQIDIPPSLIGGAGEHYALEVDGDSMTKAGINNGDVVIIQRTDTAENGAIVVALIDDHEATLKRLRRAGGKIVLEPENDAYEPRVMEPHRVKIQGKLVSLFRTYH